MKKNRILCLALLVLFAMCAISCAAMAEEVVAEVAEEAAAPVNMFYQTAWSLLPPVIAIALALITKEVYSSLFIGILAGGLLYSNFNFEGTLTHVFCDGIGSVLADSYNVGILVFLVILGAMVCLMNKAGGSAAFGRWASSRIKSRTGAMPYVGFFTMGGLKRRVTRNGFSILHAENLFPAPPNLFLAAQKQG